MLIELAFSYNLKLEMTGLTHHQKILKFYNGMLKNGIS